jgi:hypothetical protein
MTSIRVRIHRIISWWLVAFSIITVILGYTVARKWVSEVNFYTRLHMIFEWSFIVLMLYHVIYTLIFVRLRTFKLLDNPKKHWIRILQQLTKWLILIFATLVIISGMNRYEWAVGGLENWMPFRFHRLFDIFLIISMIIHVMTGAKIFFNRQKIKTWWINSIIIVLGLALIAGVLYLEVPRILNLISS